MSSNLRLDIIKKRLRNKKINNKTKDKSDKFNALFKKINGFVLAPNGYGPFLQTKCVGSTIDGTPLVQCAVVSYGHGKREKYTKSEWNEYLIQQNEKKNATKYIPLGIKIELSRDNNHTIKKEDSVISMNELDRIVKDVINQNIN
jgi:hypothetical protein